MHSMVQTQTYRCGADGVGKVTRLNRVWAWAASLWAYSRLITEKSTPACLNQCFGVKEGTFVLFLILEEMFLVSHH